MICYWLTCIHSGGKFFVPGSNRNTDFDNLGPLLALTWHPKQCRTFYGNDYAYRKVVYVASSKLSWFKNFQTVCEGEIWCLCTMTFGQKSLKLNSRQVYCLRLYSLCNHGSFWKKRVTEGGASDSWLYSSNPLKAYPLRSMYVVSIFPSCCTQWSNQAMPTAIWSCY